MPLCACAPGSWWKHEEPRTECDDKEHGKRREVEEHGVWVYRMDESKVKYEGSNAECRHHIYRTLAAGRRLRARSLNKCSRAKHIFYVMHSKKSSAASHTQ